MLSYLKISVWVKFGTNMTSSQTLKVSHLCLLHLFFQVVSYSQTTKKLASPSSLPELRVPGNRHVKTETSITTQWCLLKASCSSSSFHFRSVAQWRQSHWDPMDCTTTGLTVYHQLLELTQTHVHQLSDAGQEATKDENAIQPFHPLSSASPPTFNLSQHVGLYKWVSSSHPVAKVLAFQLQHQSFQWTPRTDLL